MIIGNIGNQISFLTLFKEDIPSRSFVGFVK